MKEVAYNRFENIPDKIKGLGKLAYNLWWSWHPEARMLYKILNRRAWKESIYNPVKMLKELTKETFEAAAKKPKYMSRYEAVIEKFENYLSAKKGWFSKTISGSDAVKVAYFSAEYGLHRSLPIYAGGLGFLAGDHIKECSDSGIPLVAIGFLYPEGYVHQKMNEHGWQQDFNQTVDFNSLPISRVFKQDGSQLVLKVPLINPPIYVAVWKIDIGRVSLYLMDTDIDANDPWNRQISSKLYAGDVQFFFGQEIVLGIGGSVVLEALGIDDYVLHLNEGHPAFALLERIRKYIEGGTSYDEAVSRVKRSSVFTTHTQVPAGHDIFSFQLVEKYFSSYWPSLNLDRDSFLRLGAHPSEPRAGFNMAAFALRMCDFRNGVSKRQGEVARKMWNVLWPDLPENSVPITHITNGVHVPTWLDPKLGLLFDKYLGRYLGSNWLEKHDYAPIWEKIDDIPDKKLWKTHIWLKSKLLGIMRERARRRWATDLATSSVVLAQGVLMDPFVLTIGFARRFATYKRAYLIFNDTERLKKIICDPLRPVQIVFAGKSHPDDIYGKRVLQNVFNATRDPQFGGRIAFVEDYGEQIAQYMVHGVDVWLNNPIPLMEASGTSGMKAALNGNPHLSILDGWWVEGFNGKNGWKFGEEADCEDRDKKDAKALYKLLEEEIIPLYYQVAEDGVPYGWVNVMKEAIKSNAPMFSAKRMVKEYVEKFYIPAFNSLLKT